LIGGGQKTGKNLSLLVEDAGNDHHGNGNGDDDTTFCPNGLANYIFANPIKLN
jgi:hypothetical protein